MISSEVQRTLVKSPPELWAELGDPEALTRHLGALGQIRITRAEPEKLVEWEAEGTSGVVQIKPSGWGTKVTLSVTRELQSAVESEGAETDETAAEDPPVVEGPAASESPLAEEPTELAAEPKSEHSLDRHSPDAKPEHDSEPTAEPRRGFFGRLFGRRARGVSRTGASTRQADPQAEATLSQDAEAPTTPEPAAETPAVLPTAQASEPSADIAAELKAAEEVAAEEVVAVLTAVLDRLGAAHHRPFSRA